MAYPEGQNRTVPKVALNVDLTAYNTLGVKSVAKEFIEIKTEGELSALADEGFFDREDPFILGGGSNILLVRDLERPVLKISIRDIRIIKEEKGQVFVDAGAGVVWHDLVSWAVERNLGGIENLALIPGTVGAAPIQNIGAYGVELGEVFHQLRAFRFKHRLFKTFEKNECGFGYRDSIFKRELKGRVIVTGVQLKLKREGHIINDSYYALKEYLKEKKIANPGIRDIFEAVIAVRKSKLPDPALLGNAGSFFKNPILDRDLLEQLTAAYPGIPQYPVSGTAVKIPAGWLIEKAGWKGKRVGAVGTYRNQALVIVNHGKASGEEIYTHARRIQESVRKLFGIELTPEVNIVD